MSGNGLFYSRLRGIRLLGIGLLTNGLFGLRKKHPVVLLQRLIELCNEGTVIFLLMRPALFIIEF